MMEQQQLFAPGAVVWAPDAQRGWMRGSVASVDGGRLTLALEEGQQACTSSNANECHVHNTELVEVRQTGA